MKSLVLATALAMSTLYATGCSVARDQQTVGSFIDDSTITTQVKSRMAKDATVSALAIKVNTLQGVVQLSGFAKNEAERLRAGAIALDVNGVTRVANDIIVQ